MVKDFLGFVYKSVSKYLLTYWRTEMRSQISSSRLLFFRAAETIITCPSEMLPPKMEARLLKGDNGRGICCTNYSDALCIWVAHQVDWHQAEKLHTSVLPSCSFDNFLPFHSTIGIISFALGNSGASSFCKQFAHTSHPCWPSLCFPIDYELVPHLNTKPVVIWIDSQEKMRM
jgi:hypothetical protein